MNKYQLTILVERIDHFCMGILLALCASVVSFDSYAESSFDTVQDRILNIEYVEPLRRCEAEIFDAESGISIVTAEDGTRSLEMSDGSWVKISNVRFPQGDFGYGAVGINLRVASDSDSSMDIILDDINSTPMASVLISATGGQDIWNTLAFRHTRIWGVHDVYLRSTGQHRLDWYQFYTASGSGETTSSVSVSQSYFSSSAPSEQYTGLVVELESLVPYERYDTRYLEAVVRHSFAASYSQYITWPNNGDDRIESSPPDFSSDNPTKLRFTLSDSSSVEFAMRASMPSEDDDSFYYRLDDGDWKIQDGITTDGFEVLSIASFDYVAAGSHTLYLACREDGVQLDQAILTPSQGVIYSGIRGSSSSVRTSSSSRSISSSSSSSAMAVSSSSPWTASSSISSSSFLSSVAALSSSSPAISSSSITSEQCMAMCQWYYEDQPRPLCRNITTGWGWENNRVCISVSTCSSQEGSGGVVNTCSSGLPSSLSSGSSW